MWGKGALRVRRRVLLEVFGYGGGDARALTVFRAWLWGIQEPEPGVQERARGGGRGNCMAGKGRVRFESKGNV